MVTSAAPLPNAIGVPINTAVIAASFTSAMDPATLTAGSFTLACPVGTPISGTVSYLAASNLVILALPAATSLPPNTVCTSTVTTGATDTAGNALANDFVSSWTTATAANTTAPRVTSTIHTNGQTDVAVNTKVGATFSEAMNPLTLNEANFYLKETVSGIAVPGTVSYSGVTALFIPSSNLTPSTQYTVTVKGGAGGVTDLAGNPMASDFSISWYTSAVADTTAPTVSGTIHTNNATNVPINTRVGATFSEGMDPLTITNTTFTLKNSSTGVAVAGVVSYSGVTALFIPVSYLSPNTRYTVTVKGGSGGVKDLEGNPMTSDFVISWTTGGVADTAAPTVIGTFNANGATNVYTNTNVGVTFSKAMDPLTITNVNFTMRDTLTGTEVQGTVVYSGVNAEFLVSMATSSGVPRFYNYNINTSYTGTIKGGIGGVTDLAGNPMASDYVWSWTTGVTSDTTAPTVTLVNPADLAQNVATDSVINVTFSEKMDLLSISTANFTVAGVTGIVSYDAINDIATFTPLSNLMGSTTYTATVTTGSADLAGNKLAVNKVWSFTTAASP
ncbi:MAG: Ig-like domain-containing protein [Gallionellaceae bacterium]